MAEFRRPLTPVAEVWDTQMHLHPLLVAYATTAADDPERARLRVRLVTGYHPLAVNIARRYAHRGEPLDDLAQVASIGLMHAIDRFDPARGRHFLAFAVPTMTGEVRRHFRDRTWAMRVPRGLKELNSDINAAVRALYQQLGRAPRPSEIAATLNVSTGAVLEALEAAHSYKAASLDKLLTPGAGTDAPGSTALGDLFGATDPGFDVVTDTHAITGYVAALPPRERAILKMRFYDDMTQIQIAEKIGVSQMHVSRLLAAVLARLRNSVLTDQPVPTQGRRRAGPVVEAPSSGGR